MLRTSFRTLLSSGASPFSSSLVLLCPLCATAKTNNNNKDNNSDASKNPFESKFARRSQKEAGMELAQTYAERFAQVHKQQQQKKNEEAIAADIINQEVPTKRTATPDNTHTGFKDNRDNNGNLEIEGLRKRLIFQSRYRGMAELDLILGSFAECVLPTASPTELKEYDAILRELDTDLFHWLVTIPGRQKDLKAASASASASSSSSPSHAKQTAQSILAGTSDYADVDKKGGAAVDGATPTVDDEFIEPKELLEAEWHRKDDTPAALEKNSIWNKLKKFCEEGREDIVKYR